MTDQSGARGRFSRNVSQNASSYQDDGWLHFKTRAGKIYIKGEVILCSRGDFKVELENGLIADCRSSKLEHKKIRLLLGDDVVVELGTQLNTSGNQKGFIVSRKLSRRPPKS